MPNGLNRFFISQNFAWEFPSTGSLEFIPLDDDATNIPLAEPSAIVRHLYYDVQLVPTS